MRNFKTRTGKLELSSIWMLLAFACIQVIALSLLLSTSGCGGGSSGTGTSASGGTVITGDVTTLSGTPIENATVTVLDTGDSTTTNANGSFTLEADLAPQTEKVTLEISSSGGSDQIEVPVSTPSSSEASETTSFSVSIKIGDAGRIKRSKSLSVNASIVGACDRSFENFTSKIRQSNPVRVGTMCTVKVTIKDGESPIGGIPFILQTGGCAGVNPPTIEGSGKTRSTGAGQITFKYNNDAEHCFYKVLAPYGIEDVTALEFPIDTYSKQKYDRDSK